VFRLNSRERAGKRAGRIAGKRAGNITGMRAGKFTGIALALVAVTTLSGCFGAPTSTGSAAPSTQPTSAASPPVDSTPIAAPTQTPVPTPTATPTPTPPPAIVDPTVLFVITATVVGKYGAKVDLVQKVYKPVDSTASMTKDTAILDEQCGGWEAMFPTRKFVTTRVTSTIEPGTGVWSKYDPIGVDMNGYPAWSGQYSGFQSACATVVVKMGGLIHGVVPVPATNSANATMGWARIDYGFAIAEDPGSTSAPRKGDLQFTACAISLSDYAKSASTVAAKWATQVQTNPGLECRFGVGF
jgi:hypothetical protein